MNTRFRLCLLVTLGFCLLTTLPSLAGAPGEEMATAARRFLDALTPEQRAKASFEFKADDRQDWHYIPKDRKGITFKELDAKQRQLGLALLRSGMSEGGYTKATNIMSLEPILAELEGAGRRFPRDPLLYHVFVFGKPEPQGTWGWRVEGHHLSANFTIVKGEHFAATPSFLGTNPAEVQQGPRQGLRILSGEEDLGRQLVKSLNTEQRKSAIFSATAPKEIFTEAKRRVQALEQAGIVASQLTSEQRQQLMKLIEEYVRRVRPELAEADLAQIRQAGVEQLQFAWAGGLEKGEGHYYRVQGPTFLLEYDNTQNNNNHVHAVWRDFDGDFGEDILRKHYQEQPHGK
jgi:Spy/CpxP family protein refolding chaperone